MGWTRLEITDRGGKVLASSRAVFCEGTYRSSRWYAKELHWVSDTTVRMRSYGMRGQHVELDVNAPGDPEDISDVRTRALAPPDSRHTPPRNSWVQP